MPKMDCLFYTDQAKLYNGREWITADFLHPLSPPRPKGLLISSERAQAALHKRSRLTSKRDPVSMKASVGIVHWPWGGTTSDFQALGCASEKLPVMLIASPMLGKDPSVVLSWYGTPAVCGLFCWIVSEFLTFWTSSCLVLFFMYRDISYWLSYAMSLCLHF